MAIREEESRKRRKMDAGGLAAFFRGIADEYSAEQLTFLCIGTDRSTGDALGPLTGSRLLEYGFPHVTGTLPAPCDADNLIQRITEIPEGQIIIAVDACLGPCGRTGLLLCGRAAAASGRICRGTLACCRKLQSGGDR